MPVTRALFIPACSVTSVRAVGIESAERSFLLSFLLATKQTNEPTAAMMNGSSLQDKRKNPDKINDGPCAQQFAALEECAKTKDPRKFRVSNAKVVASSCVTLYMM